MSNDCMERMVADMRHFASVADQDALTVANAPTVIRAWADYLANLPKGGMVTGWRMIEGVCVFSVGMHTPTVKDQQFVRYEDFLAAKKVQSVPDGWRDLVIRMRDRLFVLAGEDFDVWDQVAAIKLSKEAEELLSGPLLDAVIAAAPKGIES